MESTGQAVQKALQPTGRRDRHHFQPRILEACNGGHHMLGHYAIGGQGVVDIGQHAQQVGGTGSSDKGAEILGSQNNFQIWARTGAQLRNRAAAQRESRPPDLRSKREKGELTPQGVVSIS